MHSNYLSENVKITRILNGVVAGTSDQTSTAIDMQGWDGCLFIGAIGALTSTQVTKMLIHHSDASGSGFAATTATTAAMGDSDGNKLLMIDVQKPSKQYLKAVIDRGTANAVIDGVIAIQYRGTNLPASNGTTVLELVKALGTTSA